MLRFILCFAILIITSYVLAQDIQYPSLTSRVTVPANTGKLKLRNEDRPEDVRLRRLIDSMAGGQTIISSKDGRLPVERKSSLVGVLPTASGRDASPRKISSELSAICYDTSSRFFIENDVYRMYAHRVCKTADGNFLVSGEYYTKAPPYEWGGLLMKYDQYGTRLWTRTYDSADHVAYNYLNYSKVIELKDGSIVMAGRTNNQVTENYDLIVTKTNNIGLIQWSRVYKSRLWKHGDGSAAYYSLEDLKQDPYSGDIFISGGFWEAGKSITRFSQTDGKIVWSNLYQYSNNGYQVFDRSFGMTFEPNEIRLFGRMTLGNTLISVHGIDRANGDTLSSKLFKIDDPLGYKLEFLSCENVTVLDNGHYVLSGECYDDYPINYDPPTRPLHHAAAFELDRNLNFVRAYSFSSQVQSNVYDTRITVFPDGSGVFTVRDWASHFNSDFYYVQFKDGFITRQRKKRYLNEGFAFETNAMRLEDGGDLLIRPIVDSLETYNRLEFLKLHTSDTASICLGVDDDITSTYFFKYVPHYWPMDSIGRNVFQENPNKTIVENTFNTAILPGCYQVSHCDSLELVAPVTTICLGQELSVIARKNKDCGTIVPFSYDFTAADVVRDNDSTLRFQFKKPWSGYVYASLQGCNLMKDSLYVSVLKAPAFLNLGQDSSLCPGNTILLNAHAGYATYLWQDGSTDSTFSVTMPGIYHVKTTNGCGTTFTDTVLISEHSPIPFDAGPDRTKCNSDTLHLAAPSGFLNYSWSNNYSISSTSAQRVIVNPLIDTAYYVKAEKTPGCFAYDTVRIHVNTSPPINLGADKSFCSGDSVLFDAGGGFNEYLWSNGSNTGQIKVKSAGTFSVMGITAQGCKSYDTVRVMTVFANPVVSLDHTNYLCTGSSRTLDAGNYSSYLWNDGSTSQKIIIKSTGVYAVEVRDANGCKGSDTASITTILPLPTHFLPGDTLLCSYDKLRVNPDRSFNSYQWSSGSSAQTIMVSQPGSYWLQVKDANGCVGRDSIIIDAKDCMKGCYVPTAFSPNNDGKNDVFRPLLFGNVKKFQFVIYDRWGQTVFQTSELRKSWDGRVAGVEQDANIFIWICKYQFEGEDEKIEKGTLMLVR